MTRLHPAAPAARTLRALIGIGAALVLAVVASGCASSAPPVPTPDPFAGLADKSDQAFRQGLESYGQGQYRDALNSFEQARLLSPTVDPRIDQMVARSEEQLAPQPTPPPPVPTDVPATPSATQVPMNALAPDTELGLRYFGQVTLELVPAHDTDPVSSASQFYFQDQIGLRIDGLKQHLKLPFTLRVFNTDSGSLIAEVQSDDAQTTPAAQSNTPATAVPLCNPSVSDGCPDATVSTTPAPKAFQLVRFWDTFVWYHQGGDQPGHYRVQLYANGVLTNNLDYGVGSVPIPTPTTVVVATEEPTLEPTVIPEPAIPSPAAATGQSQKTGSSAPAPAPAAVEATVAPTQIPPPTPTVVPTPANAYTTIVGGVVAGLDVDASRGRFYLADTTGVIWISDAPTGQERPTLSTPFNIGARSPVDLAVDQSTGYLYLSTRVCAPAAPGCVVVVDGRTGDVIKSISLPGAPSDLRVDSELGLVYVGVPERQAVIEIDIRSGNLVRTIDGLPQITSLALDPLRHVLYAAHLAGQVTVIDAVRGQVTARVSLTGAGLSSIATSRGLAYGVNTATHELAVLDTRSQSVSRYNLSEEPAAVTASEDSGAVYVLSSGSSVILEMDPTTGFELGRVLLASRSAHPALTASSSQVLRPRMILNVADQTVFASLPATGTLAAVTVDQLPSAYVIPRLDDGDQASANVIPGVLQPAADAGPSQPLLAEQPPDQQTTPPDPAEEDL